MAQCIIKENCLLWTRMQKQSDLPNWACWISLACHQSRSFKIGHHHHHRSAPLSGDIVSSGALCRTNNRRVYPNVIVFWGQFSSDHRPAKSHGISVSLQKWNTISRSHGNVTTNTKKHLTEFREFCLNLYFSAKKHAFGCNPTGFWCESEKCWPKICAWRRQNDSYALITFAHKQFIS